MTKHRVYSLVCLAAAMLVAPAAASAQARRRPHVRGCVEAPIDIPVLDDLKLSHRGSMWSGGLAFYF